VSGEGGRLRASVLGRYIAYVVWGLGVVALLVTYLGVKDKQTVAAQVPYLASGGLFSVALAALGAALLIGGSSQAEPEVEELKAKVDDLAELVTLEVDLLRREIGGLARDASGPVVRAAERSRT